MDIQVKLYGGLNQYGPGKQTSFILTLPDSAMVKDILLELNIPKVEHLTLLLNGRRVESSTRIKDESTLVLMPQIDGG